MNMNPMQLIQMVKNGGNPQQMIQQLIQSNPQGSQIMGALQGKSSQEMEQYARNLAKERGVDIDALISNMGIKK